MTVSVLQVSDIHLADVTRTIDGRDPDARLASALAAGRDGTPPDVVLATGDIADTAGPDAYARALVALGTLGSVVSWVPGNHDDPAVMDQAAPGLSQQAVHAGAWAIIPLDSRWPGRDAGYLGAAEIERLEESIAAAGDRHVVLALHHAPLHRVCPHPYCALTDAEDLLSVIDARPQVKAVLSGHLHRDFDIESGGVRYLGAPPTWVSVEHGTDPHFRLTDDPPAARWLDLGDDGSVTSRIVSAALVS